MIYSEMYVIYSHERLEIKFTIGFETISQSLRSSEQNTTILQRESRFSCISNYLATLHTFSIIDNHTLVDLNHTYL